MAQSSVQQICAAKEDLPASVTPILSNMDITLLVTDVRVQRLQDISEADAIAEGIEQHGGFFGLPEADWDDAELSAAAAYARLWNSLHGPDAWAQNPWVVAVSFDVRRGNIDA